MDQELISYFDQHFREARRYTESLHEQTTQQIAGLRQEVAEQGKIRLLVEGYFSLEERLKTFQNQVVKDFEALRNTLDIHYMRLENRLRTVEERTQRQGRDPLDLLREQLGKTRTGVS
jgi:hypothetical protein